MSEKTKNGQHSNAFLRVPPNNVEAEMAVLGAMLFGQEPAIERVREILSSADFYRPTHVQIFDALVALVDRRAMAVDAVTLKEELQWRGILDEVGGVDYIMQLDDIAFTVAGLESYANIVLEKANRRRLIEASAEIAAAAYGNDDENDAIVEMAERRILAVRDSSRRVGGDARQGTVLTEVVRKAMDTIEYQAQHKGEVTGVRTGFRMLDTVLAGMQRGDLIILAGRPSMGKSAMAAQIYANICKAAGSAIFFSLEMSEAQLGQRLICSEAKVNAHHARTGFVTEGDMERLRKAEQNLSFDKGRICEDTTLTVNDMRALCRRHRVKHGLDAVFVDYIQLIGKDRDSGRGRYDSSNESRNLEVAAISKGLKALAREFDCPVVALAQLSRAVERRDNKRPVMSDLRDSGSLEADADVILFPHRPSYYEDQELAGNVNLMEMEEAEIGVAKQRMGARGIKVPIGFTPAFARFDNITQENESRF